MFPMHHRLLVYVASPPAWRVDFLGCPKQRQTSRGTSRWVLHTLQQLAHVAWRWLGLGLGLGIEDEMQFLDVPQVEYLFSCHKDNITSWDIMYVHVLMLDDWCNPWWWNERFCKLFIEDTRLHCEWIQMISSPVPFQWCPSQVKGQVSRIAKGFLCWYPLILLDSRIVSTCHGRIASVLIPTPDFMVPTPKLAGKKANDLYE